MRLSNYLYENITFKKYFEKYYSTLVLFALNFLSSKETSEDVVQDVFIKVWEKEVPFDNEHSLKSYLYTATKNASISYLRRNKLHTNPLTESEFLNSDDEIERIIIKEETYRKILMAIEDLPPQCRKIYKLSAKGLKPSEIAEDLGLAIETVKSQKKRAKKILRERLGILTYLLIYFIKF